jgi:hypothetical protein
MSENAHLPFGKLMALSKVEGESRKVAKCRIILDPGSHAAPQDLPGMTDCDTACEEMPTPQRQACPVLDMGVEMRIIQER